MLPAQPSLAGQGVSTPKATPVANALVLWLPEEGQSPPSSSSVLLHSWYLHSVLNSGSCGMDPDRLPSAKLMCFICNGPGDRYDPIPLRWQESSRGCNSGVESRTQGLVNKPEQSGRRGKRNKSLRPSSLPHGKFKTSPSYRRVSKIDKYWKLHFVVKKKLSPRGK